MKKRLYYEETKIFLDDLEDQTRSKKELKFRKKKK